MLKSTRPALCALLAAAIAAPAWAAAPGKQPIAVTNTSDRLAHCTVVVDGKTRTFLAIRPGKTWSDAFDPRREVLLVCERSKGRGVFGPLKAGGEYRLVGIDGKVALGE